MKKLFMIVMVFVSSLTFANEVECLSTLRKASSKFLEGRNIFKKDGQFVTNINDAIKMKLTDKEICETYYRERHENLGESLNNLYAAIDDLKDGYAFCEEKHHVSLDTMFAKFKPLGDEVYETYDQSLKESKEFCDNNNK